MRESEEDVEVPAVLQSHLQSHLRELNMRLVTAQAVGSENAYPRRPSVSFLSLRERHDFSIFFGFQNELPLTLLVRLARSARSSCLGRPLSIFTWDMRLVTTQQWDMRLVTAQAVGHAFGLFLVREHAFGYNTNTGHAFGPSTLRGHAFGL